MNGTKYDLWDFYSRVALCFAVAGVLLLNAHIASELGVFEGLEDHAWIAINAIFVWALIPAIEMAWSTTVPLVKSAYRRATA